MSIITHLEKNIKKYDIDITELIINKGLKNELKDFILRAAANKLQPKDSVILSLISEEIDRKIVQSKQRKERYNIHSKEKRVIFLAGIEWHFTRNVYVLKDEFIDQNKIKLKPKKKGKPKGKIEYSIYTKLLDKELGITNYQRIDYEFALTILSYLGKNFSYNDIAKIFPATSLTSATIFNLISRFKVNDLKERSTDEPPEKLKHQGNIYIENDATFKNAIVGKKWVKKSNGNWKREKIKKKKEINIFVIHTGFVDPNAKRRQMANKKIFITMNNENKNASNKKRWEYIYEQVKLNYEDADKAKIFIIGDGANGIKKAEKYIKGAFFIIDKFHVSKKIKDCVLGDRTYKKEMATAMREVLVPRTMNGEPDFEGFNVLLNQAFKNAEDNARKIEKLIELQNYIEVHKIYIQRWSWKEYVGSRVEAYISHYIKVIFRSRPKIFNESAIYKMFLINQLLLNGVNVFEELKELKEIEMENEYFAFKDRFSTIIQKVSKGVGIPILNISRKTGNSNTPDILRKIVRTY